jgi:poly(3-hydroxybutyrate) depolymerase
MNSRTALCLVWGLGLVLGGSGCAEDGDPAESEGTTGGGDGDGTGDGDGDGDGDGTGDGDGDGDGSGDGDGDGDGDGTGDGDGDGDGGSSGCGLSPDGIATSLDVAGEARTFELYLPADYDPDRSYPLIYALHGLGGDGSLAQAYFGIQQQVGSDALVVYPDALPLASRGGQTGWALDPQSYDFEFFDALHQHVVSNLCVDEDRVFAAGHSFGGYMSNSLGCYRGDVLSAVAPVAGGGPFWGACDGPVAAWLTHGEADDSVDLAEGESSRDTWLQTNGCSESSAATDPSPCVAYEGCGRDVHWCQHPGGHEWPDFAAAAIWGFFEAQ